MVKSEGVIRFGIALATAVFTLVVTAAATTATIYSTFVPVRTYERDIRRIESMIERLYEREFGRPYTGQEPAVLLPRIDQPVRRDYIGFDGKFYNRAIPNGSGLRYWLYFST